MHLLSPGEAQMMKKLNPKRFAGRAWGRVELREPPAMAKLPPLATPKLYQ